MSNATTTQILEKVKSWTMGKINSISEKLANKVTSISNASTDTQYPSAKCVYDKWKANADAIGAIEGMIPSQASSSNKLADKDFVNSSIATNTATFRGTYNLVNDLSLTTSATEQQIAAALATKMSTLSIVPDNNDYAFVQIPTTDATPTEIARVDRYKFNGSSWALEFSLNNSGFTAAQWATLNSGLVSGDKAKLDALPTNAELTILLNGKEAVSNKVTSISGESTDTQYPSAKAVWTAITAWLSGAMSWTATQMKQARANLGFGNGDIDDVPTAGSNNVVKSGGIQSELALGAVYDVSAKNPTAGPNSDGKWESLSALLNDANLSTLIPTSVRKGGMSIKFVLSSDNKYVRCNLLADEFSTDVEDWEQVASVEDLKNGNVVPLYAKTLEDWADQKSITTDTYTDAVRTTGGDIPVETSAGSKPESIKPVAGSKWTAKMLFNGSYNMLNAAKWGAANSQPYVGDVGSDFVYFLVPELTLGTFGTADENNGLLFTNAQGENVEPTSVYFKPLGATVPQSLTDGTSITPTDVSYDGKTYKDYATSGAGWLIIPKTYYDNDVCAHIAWEDWYDKHVSLDAPNTNPEAVVGVLILEGLLALAHSDKYLRGINEEVCDNAVFGDTSSTITHMVDEISVAANAWTNAATGESDSHGNALYRHSATVSLIKQGGAACIEGEDGGIPLTVNGTTVSYVDTNATAPASVVFYEVTATSTTKAYTDSIFSGSNINTETGILPINDCSIEAQVAMDGKADITVKYAKNIVDQVAINATVDVPQIKRQVEDHEERIEELEETAVRTGSYDASVSVGLADNLRGDTIVNAEFYKRKTGGTQSVGSGIAAIKEVRGKSIVWNQILANGYFTSLQGWSTRDCSITLNEDTLSISNFSYAITFISKSQNWVVGHKYLFSIMCKPSVDTDCKFLYAGYGNDFSNPFNVTGGQWNHITKIGTVASNPSSLLIFYVFNAANATIVDIKRFQIFDLTLMFGAGNEPATVAEFEKMFPLDYYAYNIGEVIPFAAQNLVTTGRNQYNPITGKANLLGGQTYQISGTYTGATIDGVAVTLDSNNCFTTTKDCVLDVTGGNDTDTFVGIYNGENNTYEPYERHTLPLDPSQWRDKQSGNLVFPYGGMHGVGTAYDYAKVDADGYIRKAVRVFGQVDLGTLSYYLSSYYSQQDNMRSDGIRSLAATSGSIISSKYRGRAMTSNVATPYITIDSNKEIRVFNSGYTNAETFKTAMNGVYAIYELATPVEVELATPVYAKYLVDKDGTEEITPANGTTPYTTMANLSILYAMDARGEIKNLPKNYLSKESAENMLNAMVSAGIIASYTMTWDAANNRYAFTFQKSSEPEEQQE